MLLEKFLEFAQSLTNSKKSVLNMDGKHDFFDF